MGSIAESLHESSEKSRLFFVLSGEHASLPAAEVEAILDSAGIEFAVVSESYRLLIMEAPRRALKTISERSLMYDWCGIALGKCEADEKQIDKLVRSLPLEDLVKGTSTFAVRSAAWEESTRLFGELILKEMWVRWWSTKFPS